MEALAREVSIFKSRWKFVYFSTEQLLIKCDALKGNIDLIPNHQDVMAKPEKETLFEDSWFHVSPWSDGHVGFQMVSVSRDSILPAVCSWACWKGCLGERVPFQDGWTADDRIQGVLGPLPDSQQVSMWVDVHCWFLNYTLAERV